MPVDCPGATTVNRRRACPPPTSALMWASPRVSLQHMAMQNGDEKNGQP